MIDPSIPLQVKTFDPGQSLERAYSLRDMMQQGKMREMQMQQAQDEAAQRKSLRDLLPTAVKPDGSVDYGILGQAALKSGDLQSFTSIRNTQATEAKATREAKAAQLEYAIKGYDAVDRALAGVSALPPEQRNAAWAAERQRLGAILDPETLGELPQQVDDATIQRFRMAAMDGKERSAAEARQWDQQFKTAQFAQTRARDADASARGWAGVEVQRLNATKPKTAAPMTPLQQLQAQKLAGEMETAARAKEGAAASFDTAIGTIDRLMTHPGRKAATGGSSMLWTRPGSEAANFEAELEALKAQAFLPMVQSLRGMGALSNAEGEKLVNAVGALSVSQSESAFKASLGRIKADLAKARARTGGTTAPTPKGKPRVIDFNSLPE